MSEFVKYPGSPLAADGFPILIGGLIVLIVFAALFLAASFCDYPLLKPLLGLLTGLALVFFLFSVWFFRDPVRAPEKDGPGAILSAADGRVLKVEHVNDPRYGEPGEKISIFMSPFDVHVNRAPIAGVVEKVEYVPGKFLVASLDKASTDNERNLVIIKSDSGVRVGFLQIAGLIARRIVCHVQPGDRLSAGQRYGMIRFGSRMELFLPAGTQVDVKAGDRVEAGKTVVARLAGVR